MVWFSSKGLPVKSLWLSPPPWILGLHPSPSPPHTSLETLLLFPTYNTKAFQTFCVFGQCTVTMIKQPNVWDLAKCMDYHLFNSLSGTERSLWLGPIVLLFWTLIKKSEHLTNSDLLSWFICPLLSRTIPSRPEPWRVWYC